MDTIIKQKGAYGFGQFSKFIRPGMVRIGSGSFGMNSIYVVAFKDLTTSKKVIVVVNGNGSAQSINLTSVYTLTPFYVVSFVVNGSSNESGVRPNEKRIKGKSNGIKLIRNSEVFKANGKKVARPKKGL